MGLNVLDESVLQRYKFELLQYLGFQEWKSFIVITVESHAVFMA